MKVKVDTCNPKYCMGVPGFMDYDGDPCGICDRYKYGEFIQYINTFWTGRKIAVLINGKIEEYSADKVYVIE